MSGFGIVIYVVCGLGILVAIGTVLGSGKAWQEYQERGMVMERERSVTPAPASSPEAAEEIRQMLEASNARHERRGEPTVDIDAEVARLTSGRATLSGAPDPDVVAEVRLLVQKRNARRVRSGEEPLDVESEVARRLAELR